MIVGSMAIVVLCPTVFKLFISKALVALGKSYDWVGFQWNNMFLLIVLLLFFIAMYYKEKTNKGNLALTWGFLCALPVQALGFYISTFSRAAIGIFLPFVYVLFPNVLHGFRDKRLAAVIEIASYALLFEFYLYVLPKSYNIPYVSIFNTY